MLDETGTAVSHQSTPLRRHLPSMSRARRKRRMHETPETPAATGLPEGVLSGVDIGGGNSPIRR